MSQVDLIAVERREDERNALIAARRRECERNVLGAVLIDNRALDIACEVLSPSDFSLRENQIIFSAMLALDKAGKPIDPLTLGEALERDGNLEKAGGLPYLSALADGLPRRTNVEFYAREVNKSGVLRAMSHRFSALQAHAEDLGADPEEILQRARSIITELGFDLCPPEDESEDLLFPDMPTDVLDGRLGEFYYRHLSHFPVAYAWPALVTVAGTLVPSSENIRTNLNCALVGSVGTGKTQAIETSIRLLGLTSPMLEQTMAGSAEGLLAKLEGAAGEARLISVDELAHLLAKARIDNASFPFVLNRAYYASEFDLTIARGRQVHVNCRLGLIGGIVEDNFQNCFGTATTGGLHDRFIFGQCPKPHQFSYRPFTGSPEKTEPCAMTIARDVWDARDAWLKEIPGLTGRHAEHALRVAAISAAFSGRSILTAKALGPARAFAEYQSRVRLLLKPNPGENTDAKCAFAITSVLDAQAGWISRRELGRRIHKERFGPAANERALKGLIFAGDVEAIESRPFRVRRAP
jgi:hypothetical protein